MHPGLSVDSSLAPKQQEQRASTSHPAGEKPEAHEPSKRHKGRNRALLQSADFRYTYFRQLLHAARQHFTAHRLSEALNLLPNTGSPILFLRHDVKMSLTRALRMAEIEYEYGVPATYMVRSDALLYSLSGRQTRILLMELVQMGHEVGLHFDLTHETRLSSSFLRLVETEIEAACEQIEQITCRPVRSLSFQRTLPLLFGGPLLINGRINADGHELREWCISDNGGTWRDGEPTPQFARPRRSVLQLILHPIWWGDEHMLAPQRLQEFFDIATREKSPREASLFDINLAKTLPAVRRQGIYALVGGGKKA